MSFLGQSFPFSEELLLLNVFVRGTNTGSVWAAGDVFDEAMACSLWLNLLRIVFPWENPLAGNLSVLNLASQLQRLEAADPRAD